MSLDVATDLLLIRTMWEFPEPLTTNILLIIAFVLNMVVLLRLFGRATLARWREFKSDISEVCKRRNFGRSHFAWTALAAIAIDGWLWHRVQFFREHPGLVLVFVGVLGETIIELQESPGSSSHSGHVAKPWPNILLRLSQLMLIFGLGWEFLEAVHSDRQMEDLGQKSLALEKRTRERFLSEEQSQRFVYLTEKVTKIPIRIIAGPSGKDTETFAAQLRATLTLAGFKTNETANRFGFDPLGVSVIRNVPTTNPIPDLIFLANTAQRNFLFPSMEGNGRSARPVELNTNVLDIHVAIAHSLKMMGFEIEFSTDNSELKPGEWVIFVPEK